MAMGDGKALVLIRYAGMNPVKVASLLRGRWPDTIIGDLGLASPCWAVSVEDAVELARAKCRVEPLRAVVLP
jgi:hypothetical protein